MANPQTEDGYTRIANEILEALMRVNVSPYESRVLWFIFRKTYGHQKKADKIPLSQFSKDLYLDRRLVHRAIKSLESKRLLVIGKDDKGNISYGFQKDYTKWRVSSHKMTVIYRDDKTSSVEMTELSSVEIPSKEIRKEKRNKGPFSPIIEKTIRRLNELTDGSYRADSKATQKHIAARLNEGYTEADLLAVVEDRSRRWKGDPKMEEYLRPATLFNAEKFEGYLQAARANGSGHMEPPEVVSKDGSLYVLADGTRISPESYQRRYGTTPCMK